jgi:ABC-2 type transport system permease protein
MVLPAPRKHLKTTAMAAAGHLGDSPLFLIDCLLRFLRVVVLLSIWRTLMAGKGTVSGMTLEAVLTYTLIAEVFSEQLACRSGLEEAFWEGTVVTRFLRPMGMVGQFAAEMLGRWGFGFCLVSVPLLLLARYLGVNALPASVEAAWVFPISLALAVSIGLALDFIFTALMVAQDLSVWLVGSFRAAIGTLLSGALLPLALLPWGLGEVFAWLPFASMASAPLRIYVGAGEPLPLMAVQAGWSIILWVVARWLWRVNRERMVSHGG